MNQFSQTELDDKIHDFMERKKSQFPELEEGRYLIDREEDTIRGRSSRLYVFPTMKFGSLH